MLVDDDPQALRLLTRILARSGLTQVMACESGAKALEQITSGPDSADLIFLDLNMPGMDGIEFIRRLSGSRFGGGIVPVSGEDDRMLEGVEKLLEAHNLRCLGHVRKPVSIDGITKLLGQVALSTRNGPCARSPGACLDQEQIRRSIAEGQIVNHYQPLVSFASGKLVGVEALVRIQPPSCPLIYPDRFIAQAEEYGLIGDLTRTVLASAVNQAREWRQVGFETRIAINVSMEDLLALDFPDIAANVVAAVGIAPSMLTLEVTESRVMQQPRTVLDVLTRLRLKRFRLAIDDFGTGHSSLVQLRDLPFDEVKIDRGFVHGASSNPTLRAICGASLRMAQQLNLKSVAEGVETTEDWEFLRELGCDIAQGYLIAKPMPAADLLAWWQAQNIDRSAHSLGSA
jgi:EAL domain-containing protein (putative c-di-GMP-specific phosphodiesterase class I)/ActR/RegA family two-component response regulator